MSFSHRVFRSLVEFVFLPDAVKKGGILRSRRPGVNVARRDKHTYAIVAKKNTGVGLIVLPLPPLFRCIFVGHSIAVMGQEYSLQQNMLQTYMEKLSLFFHMKL